MKLRILCLLLVFFIHSSYIFGQNPVQVIKSEKTETIDGKKFYIHEVKQGQTIYSICKAYGVEQSDIALVNQDVFEGLKPGQLLKIPVTGGIETTEVKTHTVEKGETLYGLSKKYNVSVDNLLQWNPELKDGLKNGQIIKVSVKTETKKIIKDTDNKPDTANPVRPAIHIVKEKETVFGISKLYNISIVEIEQNNPQLASLGLRTGDSLVINFELYKQQYGNRIPNGPLLFPAQTMSECIAVPLNRPVRLAIILPFSNDMQLLEKEDIKIEKDPNLVPQAKPYLEYYEGFLIALDSLKEKNINAEIYTFDSHRDSSSVADIISSGKLSQMDIVIGPVYQKEYVMVSDYCKQNGIWSVFPMNTRNKTIESNPYVIQINPSYETQIVQAIKYMASFADKNYIIVYNDTADEKAFVNFYKQHFISLYNQNFPGKTVPYNELYFREKGIDGIKKAMKDSCNNVVILTSNHQAFILDMLNRLNTLSKTDSLVFIMMPQWKRFEKNIEFDHLFNMNAVSFEPFNIDNSNPLVINFQKEYKSRYKSHPGDYSYLGYDTGIFFITIISKYGKDFSACLNTNEAELLHTEFYFERDNTNGGFENKTMYFFKCYSDGKEFKEYRQTGKVKDKVILSN